MKKIHLFFLAIALLGIGCSHTKSANEGDDKFVSKGEEIGREVAEVGVGRDDLSVGGKTFADLEHCGGTAELYETYSRLYLNIKDSNCGTVYLNEVKQQMDGEGNDKRSAKFEIPKLSSATRHKITVISGSKKSQDVIYVYVPSIYGNRTSPGFNDPVQLSLTWSKETNEYSLPNCKGTVRATSKNGNAYLIFTGLKHCYKYDILSNVGGSINYNANDLNTNNASYSGTKQLPRHIIEEGFNGVIVKVYNPRNGTHDKVKLNFVASSWRW